MKHLAHALGVLALWGAASAQGWAQAGCLDPLACNYDSAAVTDDGSCNYLTGTDVPVGEETVWHVGLFLSGTIYEALAGPCEDDGGANPNLSIYGALVGDGSEPLSMVDVVDMTGLLSELAALAESVGFGICGEDITVNALGQVFLMVQQGEMYVSPIPVGPNGEYLWAAPRASFASGCADPTAANFSGPCDLSLECLYNVTFRVNMGTAEVGDEGVHVAGSFNDWDPAATPMTLLMGGVYQTTLALPAGYYEYKFLQGASFMGAEYAPYACAAEFTTNRYFQLWGGTVDLGTPCFGACGPCEGCTDPLYASFDPFSVSNPALCVALSVPGCTDPAAENFDAAANVDNGTCITGGGSSGCEGDLDGDGAVTSSDLLSFLSLFGAVCF